MPACKGVVQVVGAHVRLKTGERLLSERKGVALARDERKLPLCQRGEDLLLPCLSHGERAAVEGGFQIGVHALPRQMQKVLRENAADARRGHRL